MGSLTRLMIFLYIFATITLKSNAGYLFPITKHEPTNQFYTTINIGSTPVNLLLDLGTNLTWLNCRQIRSLPSLVTCESSTCKSIPGNGCHGNSCLYKQPNPLGLNPFVTGRVVQGRLSIFTPPSGISPSQGSIRHFTFSCASEKSLQGLPPPVAGVASLSPGPLSFTKQVMSSFGVIPKFSLCLPSSDTGHFHIGGAHNFISPFNDSSYSIPMTLTPLKQTDSGTYIFYVTSIYVDGFTLQLNPNLLECEAKLSTVVPYTVLHTDIYDALAQSFTLKAKEIGISKVPAIAPFKDCFDASVAGKSMTGLIVPLIEIGVPGRVGEVKWIFHGANTMVKVTDTVMCLAFLDGGKKLKELMVVGTHQLQDYMLEIDFSTSLLAFSDSLLLYNTNCSAWP